MSLRSLIAGAIRAKTVLSNRVLIERQPRWIQKYGHHDGPPQPFDNMPFKISSRYAATLFFSVFFGLGLWTPFFILWYSMAKRTL